MLSDLAQQYSVVKDTFVEAGDALSVPLWDIVCNGPEEQLNQTQTTQPAMLAAGVAVWRVWRQCEGAKPDVMAGHSLGEYSALVCADALSFVDAVKLVADRARFMQEAVPVGQGSMAAIIGLEDEAVRTLCKDHAQSQVLEPVNFNSPGQVVIAGNSEAVNRAVDNAKAVGAKRAILLPVSVPSHCALMQPAAEKMAQRLRDVSIQTPAIPVIHNSHVKSETEADAIRNALVQQIKSPVRWVETIRIMVAMGADFAIEAGPGKVLSGLNRRIDKQMKTQPVFDTKTLEQGLEQLVTN
jgi:[acyl-carrier-protein] S-malonyltransferase